MIEHKKPNNLHQLFNIFSEHADELSIITPNGLLFLVSEEQDYFDKKLQKPKDFAKRLLLLYKIGGAFASGKNKCMPFSIRHCFDYLDAKIILKSDPTLMPRLYLCYLDKIDILEEEIGIAWEIFNKLVEVSDQIRSQVKPSRDTLPQVTGGLHCDTPRGGLSPVRTS